jgi:hypothetical protein
MEEPHAFTHASFVNPIADGIDNTGTILIGDLVRNGHRQITRARLPIGWVNSRGVDANSHLTGAWRRIWQFFDAQDILSCTALTINGCLHLILHR